MIQVDISWQVLEDAVSRYVSVLAGRVESLGAKVLTPPRTILVLGTTRSMIPAWLLAHYLDVAYPRATIGGRHVLLTRLGLMPEEAVAPALLLATDDTEVRVEEMLDALEVCRQSSGLPEYEQKTLVRGCYLFASQETVSRLRDSLEGGVDVSSLLSSPIRYPWEVRT